jgi:excisionase family DNA binding protein
VSQKRNWTTLQGTADYYGVHENTVRGWIASGAVKAYRMPGKSRLLRVDLNELDDSLRPLPAA